MPSSFGNGFMKAIIVSPLHALLGDGFAVITVTGRKTGRRIATPINVSTRGGEFIVISYRNRTWWRNLLDGRRGELHHRGKTIPVEARILDQTPAVAAELKKYFETYPGRAKYFGIRITAEGHTLEEDLTRAAEDRVVVLLMPRASG
jgi:deazaflavin-dependent oxidoreductase (nitroreductase family)